MYVYCITNLVNGKYYVGKTIKSNLQEYLRNKFSKAKIGEGLDGKKRVPLLDAIRAYGSNNFIIESLSSGFSTNAEICEAEKAWIILLQARDRKFGYNVCAGGEGVLGRLPMSAEGKKRISDANKGHIPWNKGKTGVYSKETLERMGAPKRGKTRVRDEKGKFTKGEFLPCQ